MWKLIVYLCIFEGKEALQPHEVKIKDAAKKTVSRTNELEKVVGSLVQSHSLNCYVAMYM